MDNKRSCMFALSINAHPHKRMNMEVNKEVLTVEETCALLTIGRSTLHQYIKKGVFKSYKLGTRVFLMREEVIEAIKANPTRVGELEMGGF